MPCGWVSAAATTPAPPSPSWTPPATYRGCNPASQQARDLERFRWFSGDYLAVAGDDTITDIRYALVPNEIDGLWGIITLSPHAAPHEHVRYAGRRTVTAAKRQAFRDMLLDR